MLAVERHFAAVDHDVLILQVSGRKHWRVYPMTRPHPLRGDRDVPKPEGEPVWDGVLEDGDVLYLPRGWWHVATPLDEPTLHLTVGVSHPTGMDFLSWFIDRLRDAGVVRQDLPHLQVPAAMETHANALRDAILEAWHPELLGEYMEHLDGMARARPTLAFPWSATPDVVPEGSFTVQWLPRRSALMEAAADRIAVEALGRRWTFRREAGPVLERLVRFTECSNSDLESIQGDMLSPSVIRSFVRELAANELVVIR